MPKPIRSLFSTAVIIVLAVPLLAAEPATTPVSNRPRVPGDLHLRLQERRETPAGSGKFEAREREVHWKAADTAIIICDMWDDHYCQSSAQRVALMAPKMNQVITAARSHGVMIIHAPSGTMDLYVGTPHRTRMQQARPAAPKTPLLPWCNLDPTREPALPIDTSVCACDDADLGPVVRRYTRQHAGLDIISYDGISDNGQEIFNFCEQEGITNIALMGVHTNMCVLGRPFGIRQMVGQGKNVVLVRDLTDAMYDPRQPPYVSHARGTELVIEHIETHWCPSILSEDLTQVVAGTAGPVKQEPATGPQ